MTWENIVIAMKHDDVGCNKAFCILFSSRSLHFIKSAIRTSFNDNSKIGYFAWYYNAKFIFLIEWVIYPWAIISKHVYYGNWYDI